MPFAGDSSELAGNSCKQTGSHAQDWGRKFLPSTGGCAYIDLDHLGLAGEKKFGTVGAVAKDKHGNLAAATSTGGVTSSA